MGVRVPTLGSLMMRLASATHPSQMNTRGPAASFDTSAAVFPQKEQANCLRMNMIDPHLRMTNASIAAVMR
jgi:hypothetical protein